MTSVSQQVALPGGHYPPEGADGVPHRGMAQCHLLDVFPAWPLTLDTSSDSFVMGSWDYGVPHNSMAWHPLLVCVLARFGILHHDPYTLHGHLPLVSSMCPTWHTPHYIPGMDAAPRHILSMTVGGASHCMASAHPGSPIQHNSPLPSLGASQHDPHRSCGPLQPRPYLYLSQLMRTPSCISLGP